MSDIERAIEALKRADAAGNVEDARKLAQAIKQMRAERQSAAAQQGGEPMQAGAAAGLGQQESTLSDRFWNDTITGGVLKSLWSGLTLPRDVYEGRVDPKSEEGIGRVLELGAIGSPMAVAKGTGKAITRAVAERQGRFIPEDLPSAQQLQDAGRKVFKEVPDMGVDYDPAAVQRMAQTAKATLERQGLTSRTAKDTHEILDALANPPEGAVASIQGLWLARQELRKIAQKEIGPEGPTPAAVAAEATIRDLDRFLTTDGPASAVAGPAAASGERLGAAIKNYAAGKSSERLTTLQRRAGLRAAAANSGQNLDNAIRSRVASVLESPKKRAGFNDQEIKLLEEVVYGTWGRNKLRDVGNNLAGGGGVAQTLLSGAGAGIGAAATGGWPGAVVGAAAPVVAGRAVKGAANKLTLRALERADATRRARSPLAEEMKRAGEISADDPALRRVLQKALLLSAASQPGSVSEITAP